MKNWLALIALGILLSAALGVLNDVAHAGNSINLVGTAWQVPNAPWITPLIACISLLLGVALVRDIAIWVESRSEIYIGAARAQALTMLVSIVLYIVLAVTVADQTRLNLSGIAVSGAVTGVIVGIAAQASFSNIIAGIVILFARPYQPGQYITARASAFAGVDYSGEVADITLFYTTLVSGKQEIRVPNSSMVASVVTLRPYAIDVYLPLTLPLARWEVLSTAGLVHQLGAALPAGRHVAATVEGVNDTSVQIGIRASIAGESERTALERALVQVLRAAPVDDHAAPHPPSDLQGP